MKFLACLALFLLGLTLAFADGTADNTVVVGNAQPVVVSDTAVVNATVDKTVTVTTTIQEQQPNLNRGIVRITTIPTVIPTVVPTTTPVTFIGYAEWTSSASSLSPFNFW